MILYDRQLHPQNVAVCETRARHLGIEFLPLGELDQAESQVNRDVAAVIFQYPNTEGLIYGNAILRQLVDSARKNGV